MGSFGLKRYNGAHTTDSKQPTDGSVNGGVYTNNFFQFTVKVPTGWNVLSMGSGPQVSSKTISYVQKRFQNIFGMWDQRMNRAVTLDEMQGAAARVIERIGKETIDGEVVGREEA